MTQNPACRPFWHHPSGRCSLTTCSMTLQRCMRTAIQEARLIVASMSGTAQCPHNPLICFVRGFHAPRTADNGQTDIKTEGPHRVGTMLAEKKIVSRSKQSCPNIRPLDLMSTFLRPTPSRLAIFLLSAKPKQNKNKMILAGLCSSVEGLLVHMGMSHGCSLGCHILKRMVETKARK